MLKCFEHLRDKDVCLQGKYECKLIQYLYYDW